MDVSIKALPSLFLCRVIRALSATKSQLRLQRRMVKRSVATRGGRGLPERIASLAVILGLVTVFATAHPILDPDMWWHLAIGEAILQRLSVQFIDPLSFTNPKVWVNSQWLSEAILALLHRLTGVVGLEALALALKVAIFFLVFKAIDAPPLTRSWVTILFAFGASPLTGGARPQLISFLFLAWLALTVHQHRRASMTDLGRNRKWRFWGLPVFVSVPLLFALWGNIHSFYPIALALFLLAIIADWLNEMRGQRPVLGLTWRRQMALSLLLCTVAVMITPFGWHSPKQVIVNIVQSSQLPIEEWKPALATRHPSVLIWACLLSIWLFCLAWSPKQPDALELLWGAFSTLSALTGIRMIVLWCVIVTPFVGEHLGQWISRTSWVKATRRLAPPIWLPTATIILLAFLSGLIVAVKFAPSEFAELEQKEYPQRAIVWLKSQGMTGNCLTRYDWGGYVAWRSQGQIKVFVDGRADFYPLEVLRHFIAAYFGRKDWHKVLDRYGVTMVIAPPNAPISSLLSLHAGEWQCLYRDKIAIVFTRCALATSPPAPLRKLRKASAREGSTELPVLATR